MSAAIMNGYDITSMGTLGEIAMKAGEDIPVTYGGGLDWQIKQREFREDMSYWERSNVELAQIGAEFRAQGMDTFSKKQLEQKFINDYGMTVPMAKLKASNMLSDPMKRFEQELNTLAEMDNFVDNRIGKFGAISAQAGIAVRQWWNEGFGEAASDWVGGVRNMGYGVSNALSNDPLAGDARDFSDMVKTSDTLGAYFKREKDYAAASPEERAKMDQVEEARLNVQGVIGPDGTKRERTTIEMLEAINGDPSLVGKAAGFMLWQGGEYGLSSRTKDMKEARDALVASGIDEKTADTIKYSDVNDIVTKGTFRGDKLNGVQLRNIKSRLDSDLVIASENPRADEETRMQIDAEQYNDYRDKMVRKFYGKDSVIDSKYKLDKDNYSNWDMVGGWGIVEGAGAALQFLTGDLLPSVGEGNRRARDNKGRVRRMKEEYADREYDDSEEGKNQAKQDSFALQLLENAAGDDGDENLKLMEENPQLARETFERELKSVENYRELAENTDDKELKRLYLQQADDMEGLYAPLLEMANSEDFKAMEYHKQSVLAEQGERNLNKGIERYEANKEAFDKAGITPDTMEGKTFLATIGKVSDKLWDDNSKEVLKKGKTAKETVTLVDALVEQTEEEEDEQAKKDKEKYGDYQNAGLIKKATEGDGTGEGWFDSVKQTNTLLTHIYDQMITLTNSTVQTKDSEALRQKQNTPSINYRTTTS
ncbi:MAG: hypothetical protein H8D23_00865 [Candidatus Brocadiales bacterium]|nr:hypothetical protein [Candidatus Brocadiales bacterium]